MSTSYWIGESRIRVRKDWEKTQHIQALQLGKLINDLGLLNADLTAEELACSSVWQLLEYVNISASPNEDTKSRRWHFFSNGELDTHYERAFVIIAPLILSGSWAIVQETDQNELYRYYFRKGVVYIDSYPKIVWGKPTTVCNPDA